MLQIQSNPDHNQSFFGHKSIFLLWLRELKTLYCIKIPSPKQIKWVLSSNLLKARHSTRVLQPWSDLEVTRMSVLPGVVCSWCEILVFSWCSSSDTTLNWLQKWLQHTEPRDTHTHPTGKPSSCSSGRLKSCPVIVSLATTSAQEDAHLSLEASNSRTVVVRTDGKQRAGWSV